MSGRRLLDLITLLNASRNVVGKHIGIRRRDLDVYARTSSLTKEVKIQADKIALAVQAASDLARKLNESSPPPPTSPLTTTQQKQNAPGQSPEITVGEVGKTKSQVSEENTSVTGQHVATATPESGLQQEQTREDVVKVKQSFQSPNSASLGEFENAAGSAKSQGIGAEEEPSEEVVSQLFRSPRVGRSVFGQAGYGLKQSHFESLKKNRSSIPGIPPSVDFRDIPTLRKIQSAAEPTVSQPPASEDKVNARELLDEIPTIESLAQTPQPSNPLDASSEKPPYEMVESRVPSSRLGRLWEYGGLAASMAFGVLGESIRRTTGGRDGYPDSLLLSPANIERLVNKLSKMRGAALKLGQMMSFQDLKMLPPTIQEVLQRVQDKANYMPASQRDKVMSDNLGPNWRDLFESFDEIPMAAASIGQVHAAVLKETGQRVAVKVQYPGVADSINSDLSNLSILLTASKLLPKGLYLDKTIANARTELAWECDYVREAECGRRFKELLADDASTFVVPEIIDHASGPQVLTMERMDGIAVTRISSFTQSQRDWIGTQILRLCLREICEFRYMQTDPNWTNFLYNAATGKLELLDFGASRAYPASFMNTYIRVLIAASQGDREACRDLSLKLGYLTGYESKAMVDAHVTSILTLAEPFMKTSPDIYDFSDQTITDRVRGLIPLMLKERLTPPPEETYSLHRKLSGAFLLCARLGSRVRCKELFEQAVEKVDWNEGERESVDGADAKATA
ncbi:hypothetical protein VTO42DRAFT_2150 [Malbranchea cinnamomea]